MTELISVCLCTYRRQHLAKTLDSLMQQDLPEGVSLEIVVADNDSAGSGRAMVEAAQARSPYPIRYDIEPRQGISYARNKTLDMAQGDWIALTDDDVVADPGWIKELYRTAKQYKAASVSGVVDVHFERTPPHWMVHGGYYERPKPETGKRLYIGRTGNALVDNRFVRTYGLRFDEAYAKTGSEDAKFFEALKKQGGQIIASQEAVVSEFFPEERISLDYLKRRALRQGENHARIHIEGKGLAQRLGYILFAAAKIVLSAVLMVAMMPFGRAKYVKHYLRMILNWGKLKILVGATPREFYT